MIFVYVRFSEAEGPLLSSDALGQFCILDHSSAEWVGMGNFHMV